MFGVQTAQAQETWKEWKEKLRSSLFGRQNERVEAAIDFYFRLSPDARTGLFAGSAAGAVVLILGILALYIGGLRSLQGNLDGAFSASSEIQTLKRTDGAVKERFTDLQERLTAAAQGLALVSVLDDMAKEMGLSASGFPAQLPLTEFTPPNPLAGKFQTAKVEFKIANASIRKLVEFVLAIESTPHLLRVSQLKIKGLYQNKQLFDASLEVEATVSKK